MYSPSDSKQALETSQAHCRSYPWSSPGAQTNYSSQKHDISPEKYYLAVIFCKVVVPNFRRHTSLICPTSINYAINDHCFALDVLPFAKALLESSNTFFSILYLPSKFTFFQSIIIRRSILELRKQSSNRSKCFTNR